MFLPPELYRPIIQNVGARPDLYSLLFVSRLVSYEAERALYYAIEITPPKPSSVALILRLSRCQRVASYVRKLELSGHVTFASPTSDEEELVPSHDQWHTLNQALCAVTNLRMLRFETVDIIDKRPSHGFVSPPFGIFSNCTFKLEFLEACDNSSNDLPLLDLSLVKEIRLQFTRPCLFSPYALPSLRILSCYSCDLHDLGIENSRQIKAFEFESRYKELAFNMIFTNITSLKCKIGLNNKIRYLPSLRYLYTWFGRDYAPAEDGLSELISLLSALNDLEKLCLIMLRERETDWPSDMVVQLFSAISSLQELVIVHGWEGGGNCWNRNDRNPIPVSKHIIESEWKDPRWL